MCVYGCMHIHVAVGNNYYHYTITSLEQHNNCMRMMRSRCIPAMCNILKLGLQFVIILTIVELTCACTVTLVSFHPIIIILWNVHDYYILI